VPEPQETVEPQTAQPEAEAQSEQIEPQETATPLTLEAVKALIDETMTERETNIRRELDQAYKTLRRGEAKSDVSHKRIDKLEQELFDISTRGLEPAQVEMATLKRQLQRDAESRTVSQDPSAEVSAFQSWSSPYLEEEGIKAEDPVLVAAFQKHASGWQNAADLRIAMTRAVADVHKEQVKKARSEAGDREKKAREEERAKLRNENRQAEGKIDKGAAAGKSAGTPKNWLAASQEEWDALQAQRGLKR